jgi:uncharacterized protein (DUF427 family)
MMHLRRVPPRWNERCPGRVPASMIARARWNGQLIAESDETVVVEGNHYFPIDSVVAGMLEPTRARSLCPWKGIASYSDVVVDDVRCPSGAWSYRHPTPFARRVKDRVAFWRGVEVTVDS